MTTMTRTVQISWCVAALALMGARPAMPETEKRVEVQPRFSTDIKGFRVVSQSHNELELEVDYAYSGAFGDNVALGARMASDGQASPYAAYRPGSVSSEASGTARVTLTTAANAPDSFSTNQVVVQMYIGGSYVFLEEFFPFDKTWTKTATVALTTTMARVGLPAPAPLSPPDGASFGHAPRTTTLVWESVAGAASYTVEVDCYHCCQTDRWCSDVGKTYKLVPDLTQTTYVFDFVGKQPGRWRVWAVSSGGQAGAKSPWLGFTYTK